PRPPSRRRPRSRARRPRPPSRRVPGATRGGRPTPDRCSRGPRTSPRRARGAAASTTTCRRTPWPPRDRPGSSRTRCPSRARAPSAPRSCPGSSPAPLRTCGSPLEDRPRRCEVLVGDAQLSALGGDHHRLRVGRDQRALVHAGAAHRLHRLHPDALTHAPLEVAGRAERSLQPGRAHLQPVPGRSEVLEVEPAREALGGLGDGVEVDAALPVHRHAEHHPPTLLAVGDLPELQPGRLDHRPDQRLHVHLARARAPRKRKWARAHFRVKPLRMRFEYTERPGYSARRCPDGSRQWSRAFILRAIRGSSHPRCIRTPRSRQTASATSSDSNSSRTQWPLRSTSKRSHVRRPTCWSTASTSGRIFTNSRSAYGARTLTVREPTAPTRAGPPPPALHRRAPRWIAPRSRAA